MLVKIESVLSKWTANSADKQYVNEVLAFISEKARRKVYQSKKFLTTAAYTFILKYLPCFLECQRGHALVRGHG